MQSLSLSLSSPPPPPPPQAHVDLKIPKEHHRFVIGKEGQKLKNIELSTATKISIPRHDDSSDIIKIVGTKEGIDKAQHQIQMISDEQVCICVCVYERGSTECICVWDKCVCIGYIPRCRSLRYLHN